MKKFPRTKATGNLGVKLVSEIVFRAGSIFREIPEETDIGIDGYIEFVDNEVATGILVGVQIKSGHSFLVQRQDGKYFELNVSRADMNYWNSQPIPIALIAYDPDTLLSGWMDITGYIRDKPEVLQKDNTSLRINTLSSFTIDSFVGDFQTTFRRYRREADLFDFADMMASEDSEQKFHGFLGLISHPKSRFSKLTCFLLLKHLFDKNGRLRSAVSDAISRYLAHPEVGYFPPANICKYVESSLKDFGSREIAELLKTALLDDENLMQRGSIGQSVGVIITCIPEYEKHLCNIAIDSAESDEVRLAVIVLASEFEMQNVISFIGKNIHRVDWGEAYEAAEWAADQAFHMEQGDVDLLEVIEERGYDDESLADILVQAGPDFLAENESTVFQISTETKNQLVRFEAIQALNRLMWYRNAGKKFNGLRL